MYSNYRSVEHFSNPTGRTIKYSFYEGPNKKHKNENQLPNINQNNIVQNNSKLDIVSPENYVQKQTYIQMKWENKQYNNLSDPQVWGPSFWFTLHNGASKYPISASNIAKERMKGYIIGLPVMIPCLVCQIHATNFIEQHKTQLDDICSGREKLFSFFVKFHNKVNKRYNKPEISVEDAHKLYNGGATISRLTYGK